MWRLLVNGLLLCAGISLVLAHPGLAQQLSRRLILKDGSYQSVSQYEIKGDRVRYLSAERGEWEELPNSLVDWKATEQFEKDRIAGASTPEAAELDRELETERKEQEAKHPHVAPGLALPDEGGIFLLDTFQSEPQLVPIEQNTGEVKKNTKDNVLRAAINPLASAKQTIELQGAHAAVQSHVTVPSLYINLDGDAPSTVPPPDSQKPVQLDQPYDRFKIVRMQTTKNGKRIVGDIKIAIYGKVSQEQKLVATTSQLMTGGWVKVTPTESLSNGEYAIVEMLGKDGMNLYVWDFGVNPNAPANGAAWKPSQPSAAPEPAKPVELEKRQNQ
jgi:hypothetical protein